MAVVSESRVREWVQVREADGTVRTYFTIKSDGVVVSSYETDGVWWANGEVFSETFANTRKNPDVYAYEFLDENTLRFEKVRDGDFGLEFAPYIFTERKTDRKVAPSSPLDDAL